MSAKKEPKNRKKKHKLITKGHGKEPTVIEFNLSKAVILLIIIGVIIAVLVTKEIVTTIIEAKQNNALAEDGTDEEHAVYVQSSDGIQVPVPKGYVASQIPGETSVNGGFVIYEDNYNGQPIDWNSILVETNSLSANSLNANNAINSTTQQAPTENQAKDEEQLKTEQTNKTENTTTETTTTTEATNKTESTTTEPTNVTESTNTEQTNTETTSTEPTNTVENNTEETNTKPTTTLTNKTSTSTTTTETNKTTTNSATGNEKEENKTESTIEPNKTATQKVTETTNTEPTTTSTNTTELNKTETPKTTETTNESPKVQTNAQTTSKENSIELYADGTITQEDIFNLQKSVNQFVWVPVNDISRIYGVDSNGKLWGKLYDYDETGRTPLNWTENGNMSITSMTSNREPAILSEYDTDSQLQSYLGGKTAYELLSEMEENYYETIKSIEKYGGFYIGRYETGGLSETAVVRKMETDINNQTWYTMYEKMKEIRGSNESVKTSMIWGSLWDETLQWLIDSKAKTSDGTEITYELVGDDSTLWGNYILSTFNYIPEGATEPNPTSKHGAIGVFIIPTGSSEYTKVNNIYDMAGNVFDWTLEVNSTYGRVHRGGYYNTYGSLDPAADRDRNIPTYSNDYYGCRTLLYIK